MALTTITKKVVSYCEIPEELTKRHWLNEHHCDAYVEVHLDLEGDHDSLDEWFLANYPELADEESFFIHIDY